MFSGPDQAQASRASETSAVSIVRERGRDVLRDEPSWIGVLSVRRFPLVELPSISLSLN
jgi:hypothetical protein